MIDLNNLKEYKNKGECVAITSYCNSTTKVSVLKKTISNIKQYNLPIFLHAHYPLSIEVQTMVDFYYYSSDNPIFNRFNKFWEDLDRYRLEFTEYDFYYTTLKGWDESIKIMDEYEKIHIINYDSNLYPELFEIGKKCDKSVFLEHNYKGRGVPHIFVLYFTLKKEKYQDFRTEISLDKYINYWSIDKTKFLPHVEDLVGSFIKNDEKTLIIPFGEYDKNRVLEFDISTDARITFDKLSKAHKINAFIGEYNGRASVLFYNLKKPLTVGVKTRMNEYSEQKIYETTLIELGIPFNSEESFTLYIDGSSVEQEFINKFYSLETRIYDR